jgi:hypothetical protein
MSSDIPCFLVFVLLVFSLVVLTSVGRSSDSGLRVPPLTFRQRFRPSALPRRRTDRVGPFLSGVSVKLARPVLHELYDSYRAEYSWIVARAVGRFRL